MIKVFYFIFTLFLFVSCGTTKSSTTKSSASKQAKQSTEKRKVSSKQSLSLFHSAYHNYLVLNYDKALKEAQEYTQKEPNDDAGYFLLSKIYYLQKDSVLSINALETAASKDPSNLFYHSELGNAYTLAKNYPKAEAEFKTLTNLYPNSSEYQYGLYRSYVGQKKYDKALEVLNEMGKLNHINGEFIVQKYLLYIEKKDYAKAEKTLLDGLVDIPGDSNILFALYDFYTQKRQLEKFLPILETQIQNAPEDNNLHLLLADFYLQKKQEIQAMTILRGVFNNPEVDISTKRYFFMDNVINQPNLSASSAKELAKSVVLNNPDDAFFNLFLGSVYDEEKKDEQALYYYKKGIHQAENKKETLLRIVFLEYNSGQYDSLITDAKLAIELFPSNSSLYYFCAMGLLRTKQYQQAIEVLKEGEIYLTSEMDKADFKSIMAESYYGLKENDKGQKLYEEVIAETRENNYLKVNYALVLAKNKTNLNKAISLIDEVLIKQPKSPNALYVKSLILFQQDKFQEAKQILEELLKTNSSDVSVLSDLGDVYYKMGDIDEAVTFWKRALALKFADKDLLNKKINDRKYYEE